MQLSAAGLALIKQSEGFRGATYLDVAGVRTIGYGHKLLPSEIYPNGITEDAATALLAKDAAIAAQAVGHMVRVNLTQGQFDALVDFCYNLGSERLAGSTLLRDLNFCQYDAAAEQLLNWDHVGAKEVDALKARRAAEYQLWTGHAPAAHREV